MANITLKVPTFEMEIECPAENAADAWAQITDYHSTEITEEALKRAKIVKAVYDPAGGAQ